MNHKYFRGQMPVDKEHQNLHVPVDRGNGPTEAQWQPSTTAASISVPALYNSVLRVGTTARVFPF